ncbi:MAG: hypothetical protein K2J17_00530, partial [Paramuribaculum sp.]|nr:hypothetical protein [Paramuribaculum sp.]
MPSKAAEPTLSPLPDTTLKADSPLEVRLDSIIPGDSVASSHRHALTPQQRRRQRISSDSAPATPAASTTGPRIVRLKSDLDNPVDIVARDSMVLVGQSRAYIYGDGKVTYGDIDLTAAEIQLDMDSSTVYAVGAIDSLGTLSGSPVFVDKGTSYESKTMRYNFRTEKGYITDVITEQGEGFLT